MFVRRRVWGILQPLSTSQRRFAHVQKVFKLADIGEGITECEIIRWAVQPLAKVEMFTPICEVQSDKASVEITSPFDGIMKEHCKGEGEIVKVGDGLCIIEVEEDTAKANSDQSSFAEEPMPIESSDLNEECVPSNFSTRVFHPLDPDAPQGSASTNNNVFATPSVRHFARLNGVDLSTLIGSGKNGRIERNDVEAHLSGVITSVGSAAAAEATVLELSRTRYGMWKAMTKSLEIPLFGYSTKLDLTALHDLLPVLNANIPPQFLPLVPELPHVVSPTSIFGDKYPPETHKVPQSGKYTRLTYLPILMKTLSKAMMEWPLFRSSIIPLTTGSRPSLSTRPHSDISLAMSTPTGLYAPVIPSVDTHSIFSLASTLRHLSHLGRQVPCKLTAKELPRTGGTLSVSNVGAIGNCLSANPVLVEGGGLAIVALGRAQWEWDVDNNPAGERRLKMGISWSADHRVVEGAELAVFVECWRSWVQNPARLMGDGI